MDPEEADLLRESGPAPKRGLLSPDQRKRLIFIGVAVLGGALIVKYFGNRIGAPASAIDTSALTTPASTDSTNNTYNVYPSNPVSAGSGGGVPPTHTLPPVYQNPPNNRPPGGKGGSGSGTWRGGQGSVPPTKPPIPESAHKPAALLPPHLW